MTTMQRSDDAWDVQAIRRALRLLASHSPNITDPIGRERALRLLWDMLNRRGMPGEIYETADTSPLLICGSGPILVIVHLDDAHPAAQVDEALAPQMRGGTAFGPGVVRKAGVLAAVGLVAASRGTADRVTLVVETDRYDGSRAIEAWLNGPGARRKFDWALWETVDLPVPAPALFRGSAGRLTIKLTAANDYPRIEGCFAGVMHDTGHALIQAISALKSVDGEVLVPGFYDAVVMPEPDDMQSLYDVAPIVANWVTRGHSDEPERLSASHLTLGAFLAPALTVTSVRVDDYAPWLPATGQATIDIRLMPGQDVAVIQRDITAFLQERVPGVEISATLVRPSARGTLPALLDASQQLLRLPAAPGDSPAGLIESRGVPVTGFSTVWRDPSAEEEQVDLTAITDGTSFLEQQCERVSKTLPIGDA